MTRTPNNGGSTVGLTGCRVWLFFVVILGMQAKNRSGNREFNDTWKQDFLYLWGCILGCRNPRDKIARYENFKKG